MKIISGLYSTFDKTQRATSFRSNQRAPLKERGVEFLGVIYDDQEKLRLIPRSPLGHIWTSNGLAQIYRYQEERNSSGNLTISFQAELDGFSESIDYELAGIDGGVQFFGTWTGKRTGFGRVGFFIHEIDQKFWDKLAGDN